MPVDCFASNHALLMERFPKLALQIPRVVFPLKTQTLPFSLGQSVEALYFYGIGSGEAYWHYRHWLQAASSRRLVFLEDDLEACSAFLHLVDAGDLLRDTQVQIAQVADMDSVVDQLPVETIEVHCLPSKKGRRFQSLKTKLFRKAGLAHALYLDRMHGDQLFEHFIVNLRHLPHSFYANRLEGQFAGIPAIVCGAGPSLSRSIEQLKTLQNRALIIAGGSTIAALTSQGIVPHFGMAVDPNPEEYDRLRSSFGFEMPLLYSTRVFPDIFQTCNGPFGYMRSGIGGVIEIWMEEALGLTEPLLSKGLHDETLSVTASCLAWGRRLGCNPILLSGMDLAYTNRLRYAPGVDCGLKSNPMAQLNEQAALHRIVQRKDRHGKPVSSAVRWLMESNTFSHFAKQHPETTFLNTTEGGIGFRRIPYCSLEEASERFLSTEYDLRGKVQQAITSAPMPAETRSLIDSKMAALKESLDRIVDHLSILAGEKKGSTALAEMELSEEMAYPYLFYDAPRIVGIACALDPTKEKWSTFLQLARRYQTVLQTLS